jgi:hypothetical protein
MLANAIRYGDCRKLTLVVNLACGLDEILEVSASQEVTKVDELAVPLVFHVDGTPAVLTSGDVATVQISACDQKFVLPEFAHPSMFMVCSEPTTAKGMMDLI